MLSTTCGAVKQLGKLEGSIKGTSLRRYLIEMSVCSNDVEIVKLLVERGAELDGTNTLHAACGRPMNEEEKLKRVEIVKYLLEQGMDINNLEFAGDEDFTKQYRDRFFGTTLHYAVSWGLDNIVECLLEHGADPNIMARLRV
jgi:ankyrin repeat protein